MFVPGQRVVCVDSRPWEPRLKNGSIYTISKIYTADGLKFVDLVETKENGWFLRRFKPLEENKTDISVFKKLLNPANNKVLEEV